MVSVLYWKRCSHRYVIAMPDLSTLRATALAALAVLAPLIGACASTGAVPRPFPTPRTTTAATRPVPQPDRPPVDPPTGEGGVVGTALDLRGIPYRNGGTDPTGFDCSGFTQYVYARHGIGLPREVRDQFSVGSTVRPEALQPGDLLFFTTTAPGPTHVGIAVGGDEFVHAPSSTGVVRVERLGSSYWSSRYLGARRIQAALN